VPPVAVLTTVKVLLVDAPQDVEEGINTLRWVALSIFR